MNENKRIRGGCAKYGLTTGRTIVCLDNSPIGDELFHISSAGKYDIAIFSHTERDAMAHYLVDKLNKDKDFAQYYEKYMRN